MHVAPAAPVGCAINIGNMGVLLVDKWAFPFEAAMRATHLTVIGGKDYDGVAL